MKYALLFEDEKEKSGFHVSARKVKSGLHQMAKNFESLPEHVKVEVDKFVQANEHYYRVKSESITPRFLNKLLGQNYQFEMRRAMRYVQVIGKKVSLYLVQVYIDNQPGRVGSMFKYNGLFYFTDYSALRPFEYGNEDFLKECLSKRIERIKTIRTKLNRMNLRNPERNVLQRELL